MTQRLFKLEGIPMPDSAAGIVTIDGVKVFDGVFTLGSNNESDGYLCEFAHPVEDQYDWELRAVNVMLTVTITVTVGTAEVGMLKYNYAPVPNPLLTPTELAYITDGNAAIAPVVVKADVAAKGGWIVHSPTKFAYGMTPELNYSNRLDMIIDQLVLPNEAGHYGIIVDAGKTLSFTTVIFSVPYQ
jgi:hypothetical protein